MSRQDDLEARLSIRLRELAAEFSDLREGLPLALFHALVHQAVHHAADRKLEYCAVATYLGDMIGHAHKLLHGDDPSTQAHREPVH